MTGSAARDMLSRIKSGEAAARRDLRLRLLTERLTGIPQEDGYVNAAMQWGIDNEGAAFAAYEALTGNMPRHTGFLQHPELMAGCSLDGDVDDFAGIVELKCPKSATHLGYLRSGVLPAEHLPQVMHNLLISGAAWADFLSFDPRFPEPLQVFYVRVERDDLDLTSYEISLRAFLGEVDSELADVQARLTQAVA